MLTSDFVYSRSNRENLRLRIQIQLSKNPSNFCEIVCEFLESILNFQCSEFNSEPHRLRISEFSVSERCVDLHA